MTRYFVYFSTIKTKTEKSDVIHIFRYKRRTIKVAVEVFIQQKSYATIVAGSFR
jgi:hypothetical protein